jgi:diguanylate cyclase (GGDEF)-like protein
MTDRDQNSDIYRIEELELSGFSRSITEIEWLLLILVLLYFVLPGMAIENSLGVVISMVAFAVFVLGFHYLNFFTLPARWKLAIETWVMILFLTWVLWNTGKAGSPLLNLYILVIVASALTLGKLITLLELTLIAAVYFYLNYFLGAVDVFSLAGFSDFMTRFAPFLIIAYVTTMLAADIKRSKDLLRLLSETDEMTSLQNKRSFNETLSKEIKKAARYSRKFSILLIDADNLKEVNDGYGHGAGDQLIKVLAGTMRESLRTSDIIARIGGDEFVVLLPEADHKHALEAGERIRSAAANTSFDREGERINMTVSIGIASYPDDGEGLEEIMENADRALYKSKKTGRNRVTRYTRAGREPAGTEPG